MNDRQTQIEAARLKGRGVTPTEMEDKVKRLEWAALNMEQTRRRLAADTAYAEKELMRKYSTQNWYVDLVRRHVIEEYGAVVEQLVNLNYGLTVQFRARMWHDMGEVQLTHFLQEAVGVALRGFYEEHEQPEWERTA